jgi:hypothetical protein
MEIFSNYKRTVKEICEEFHPMMNEGIRIGNITGILKDMRLDGKVIKNEKGDWQNQTYIVLVMENGQIENGKETTIEYYNPIKSN